MLNITADLIAELHDRTGRAFGITLSADGWSVEPDERCPSTLTPITTEGLDAWLDGNDPEPSDFEALTEPDAPGLDTYRIPDEDGADTEPAADATWQVVTTGPDGEDGDWTEAFWIDIDAATVVVEAPDRIGYDRNGQCFTRNRRTSLWRTAGARWVARTESDHIGDWDVTWAELTDEQAMVFIHDADPDLVDDDACAVWTAAAGAARAVTDAFCAEGLLQPRPDTADMAEAFRAVRALSSLLRGDVLSTLKTTRTTAARWVAADLAPDRQAAAELLQLSARSLEDLIKDY